MQSWGDYPSFKTPKSNNNKCEGQQQGGWGWGNLPSGGFNNYDGFDFNGFTCTDRFGKRDSVTKRAFQQKAIQGSMSESDGPSFKCGNGKDFSATKYQVSVSRDTDVEMHYSMPDGTTCKQTAKCKKDGSIVENKQCGGAKEVKFKLPQGSKEKCDLGIHYVDFDCNPAPEPPKSSSAPPPPRSSSTPGSPASSSRPVPSCAYGKDKDGNCSPAPPSSTPGSPVSSSRPAPSCVYGKDKDGNCSPPPASSAPAPPSSAPAPPSSSCAYGKGPDGSCSGPPPSSSTPGSPVSSSRPAPPPASSCAYGKDKDGACSPPPASSAPPPPASSSTPGSPIVSSSPVPPPASSCAYGKGPDGSCSGPPSSSAPPPPASSAPAPPSSSCAYGKGPDGKCSGPPSSAPPAPPSSSAPAPPPASSSTAASPPPPPSNDCPSVLPQCLNTWIQDSGCKDNSDFTCFCKNADFTKNVIQCVSAHGADTTVVSKALSYLQGICASFIPQNPGLVTDCPKDIPITPPAAVSTPGSPVPTDTVTITTQVVTETVSTCTPGQVVTDNGTPTTLTSSKISTITLTQTATYTTCGACLAGGAPSPPKYTTINIADTYTVPCTYSEGESQGYPIPGSSTITQLTTAVTVPVVGFVTAPPAPGQTTYSVGFVDGPAPGGYNGGSGPAPETPVAPIPTGGYEGKPTTFFPSVSRTSFSPVMATANAGSKLSGAKVFGVLAGGAMAVLAL